MPKITKIPIYNTRFSGIKKYQLRDDIVYQDLKIKGVDELLIFPNSSILTKAAAKKIRDKTFFDQEYNRFKNTKIGQTQKPIMISMIDGFYTNLDKIIYESPVRNFLNKKGLDIYLYEMPIFTLDWVYNSAWLDWLLKDNKTNFKNVQEAFNYNKPTIVGFESTKENLTELKCLELEKITDFVKNNNLTDVTVYAGEYQFKKYFQEHYPLLKLETKDIFTASLFQQTNKNIFRPHEYNTFPAMPKIDKIVYKFWSGNRRYSGSRNIIAAYLTDRLALVSFNYYSVDFLSYSCVIDKEFFYWNNINNKLWFNLDLWRGKYPDIYKKLKSGIDYIDKVKYLNIDKDMTCEHDFEDGEVPTEYYHSCFCAVVTESAFAQPCGHYTEKTLNAIKCFRPFVLVAPPKTLEYLKQCGVKTFDKWWDESYDQEQNHEKRLVKILELIDYIDSFSIEELRDMYEEMLPVLKHNYKIIEGLKYQ